MTSVCPVTRWLLHIAIAVFVIGAIAGVVELLAAQMPFTPLHVDLLVTPVAQLRETATTAGLLLLAVASLWPRVGGGRGERVWLAMLCLGLGVMLGAMTYGALTGMNGVQLYDPRPSGRWLAYARLAGQGTFVLALLDFARRLAASLRAPSSEGRDNRAHEREP